MQIVKSIKLSLHQPIRIFGYGMSTATTSFVFFHLFCPIHWFHKWLHTHEYGCWHTLEQEMLTISTNLMSLPVFRRTRFISILVINIIQQSYSSVYSKRHFSCYTWYIFITKWYKMIPNVQFKKIITLKTNSLRLQLVFYSSIW